MLSITPKTALLSLVLAVLTAAPSAILNKSSYQQIWDSFSAKYESEAQIERGRLALHLATAWSVPWELSARIVSAAYEQAERTGTSPTLLLAVMAKESSFRAEVTSFYGAVGLMQVVPRFHAEKLAPDESLLHPETNIRVGADVLAEYLEKTNGDLPRTLKKYSGSAREYARRVLRYQAEFESVRKPETI